MDKKRIAVIRIRGIIGVKKKAVYTMKLLYLYKVNNCIIIDNTKNYTGMLKRIKDYVTWGEIDEPTFKQLLEKRGRLPGNKKLQLDYLEQKVNQDFESFSKNFIAYKKELKDIPGLKLFFRLSPPKKGFDRKGIKQPFSLGGALGYRKEKINELIQRMI